jgi:hypothetical protein
MAHLHPVLGHSIDPIYKGMHTAYCFRDWSMHGINFNIVISYLKLFGSLLLLSGSKYACARTNRKCNMEDSITFSFLDAQRCVSE